MASDLTFITNEEGNTLSERFNTLIKGTQYFDVLVGYFYTSGFYSIYESLEATENIRVLIGISTDSKTFELIQESKKDSLTNKLSHKETKDKFSNDIVKEMETSKDSAKVELGIRKFIEWLRSGKLEVRVYPSEKIHAKLYIMSFKEGAMDVGRVITGSSNFTKSGLSNNLEFNVELKNSYDYKFSLAKFNELWEDAVDVSEKYVETIKKETWLNDSITPYELYLKFLYEYLKEKINLDQRELKEYVPIEFMNLKYQKDAVIDAKMKLDEFGGVFLSDVVGLGKTYISALLAQQLDGGTLIIAPPVLLDKQNPGSWPNVFFRFGIRQFEYESRGKLDKIIQNGTNQYKNIFIDEAHDFRNESTQMYEKLFQICRGKRVILVTATPLNNTPMDILSQIKLFQNAHKSTLPNPRVRDLERYFKSLESRLRGLDRQKDKEEYLRIVQENAEDIRENVLQYLMVRRTRSSVMKYYAKDLKNQGLKFPDVNDPEPIIYEFNEQIDEIFNKTLELLTEDFKYARYTPLLYLKKKIKLLEAPQMNMGKFMKILLLKRLESSFFAFKKSVERFIYSYQKFIEEYNKGNVYVSKKDINKIFELIENDDDEAIERLIAEEKVTRYPSEDFRSKLLDDLQSDYELLVEIQNMWKEVNTDPKVDEFIERLSNDKTLKDKVIVFTESKETAKYLTDKLNPLFDNKVMYFSGSSSESMRGEIIQNFDAKARNKKDKFRILISTDVLSQGVNLHRSNVVINYDIPWNPTRMMQRVGRVQRVDSKFDEINIYNFFPASRINENISLKEAAEAKIKAFIEMLGNDSKLLTDEEVKSHDLFVKLTSKSTITGEDEKEDNELKYLNYLREIRDNDTDLFEKIKRLPKKARTAKRYNKEYNALLTFFRKGKLRKVFLNKGTTTEEIDFFKAAEILEANKKTKKEKLDTNFYEYLQSNKKEFETLFEFEEGLPIQHKSSSYENQLIKRIRAIARAKEFTDDDEEYIQDVLTLLYDGALPKGTMKKLLNNIKNEINPLKILLKIKSGITPEYFQKTFVTSAADTSGPKEVILSEFLLKGD